MSDSIIRSLASGRGSILIFAALIISSGEALAGSEVCVVLPPGYIKDTNGNIIPGSSGDKFLTQAALEAGIPTITVIDGYWAINGIKTSTVASGENGPQGATGAKGATGSQGAAGSVGAAGAQGATGAQGSPGATGSAGSQGSSGGTCSCKCTGTTD